MGIPRVFVFDRFSTGRQPRHAFFPLSCFALTFLYAPKLIRTIHHDGNRH